jgi:hypothetical protein
MCSYSYAAVLKVQLIYTSFRGHVLLYVSIFTVWTVLRYKPAWILLPIHSVNILHLLSRLLVSFVLQWYVTGTYL